MSDDVDLPVRERTLMAGKNLVYAKPVALAAFVISAMTVLTSCSSSGNPKPIGHPALWCNDLRSTNFSSISYAPSGISDSDQTLAAFTALSQNAPTSIKSDVQSIETIYYEIERSYLSPGQSAPPLRDVRNAKVTASKEQLGFDIDDLHGANTNVTGWFENVAAYAVSSCHDSTFDSWRRSGAAG